MKSFPLDYERATIFQLNHRFKNSVDNFYRQKNRQSQFVADSMIHSVNLIAVDKILMNASTLTQHSFSENALTNDRTFNAAYFATAPDHAET